MEPIEEGELTQDQDLSSSEKKMLLRIRNRLVYNSSYNIIIGYDVSMSVCVFSSQRLLLFACGG